VVAWLKRVEQVDAFDENTDFNPFALSSATPDLPAES
jgi:hypothetical protein